ncbi:MAG: WYL domain-containing protein [Lachnospiraceae bacterium]|nr:WYL domain-containing protein [Lachnospiraceae bacterium]
MAKGANQKLKLYRLMQIMLEKTDAEHGITMSEIMDELARYDISAERKSIYSDIDELDNMGLEIVKEKDGRDFVYRVVSRTFELAEIKLLIDSIQASRFITLKKSRELINKLKTQVSCYEAIQLQRQVFINDRIKTMNESIYYSVDAIHSAIAENKKIRFLYCSWDTDKKLVPRKNGEFYEVSPWALVWADENYYLIAYDSEADKIKHYRVDKMLKIGQAESRREGRDKFEDSDLGEYASKNFGMYGGEVRRVHIEFPDEKVGIFIDRFGKDISIRSVGAGRSEIAVEVAVSYQFFGWIFGLGPDIVITSPEDIIDQLRDVATAFKDNYK